MDDKRLQPLLDLAGRRVDDAVAGLRRQRQDSAAQQARLSELQHYLTEYEARDAQPSHWQLSNHSAFLNRLRQAVVQQHDTVEQSRRAVTHAVSHWSEQRSQQRRYEVLSQRSRQQQRKLEDRREQRDADELSARRLEALR